MSPVWRLRWSAAFLLRLFSRLEMSKVLSLLVRPRMPWRLRHLLENSTNRCYYHVNWLHYRARPRASKCSVAIAGGFHGRSGGVTAIANLANMLAVHYHVHFFTYPTSNYNRLLRKSVRMVDELATDSPVLLCDVACPINIIRTAKERMQTVIVTCHALADSLHGFTPKYVRDTLLLADLVHFVSPTQQDSFKLPDDKFRIIPNFTSPIRKTAITDSVGIVGSLKDPRKNVSEAIAIALKSRADCVHLWGDAESLWAAHPRVKTHSWTSNKARIYDSFDVLIHLSKEETFGMVVIEAMSAGLPCLLSSIPAFAQFRGCPGVRSIDDNNRDQAPQILDELLMMKHDIRADIVDFWQNHFSEQAVADTWLRLIDAICDGPSDRGPCK